MAIRCASKAIIISNNCVLLNRCVRGDGSVYYNLPGGGQPQYETMEQAVIREVKEETGYDVRILRFAALAEEIDTDEKLRKSYPSYTHRIMHIFLAEIEGDRKELPSEKDFEMEKSEWIPVDEISELPEICPPSLRNKLAEILAADAPVYLGTEYLD